MPATEPRLTETLAEKFAAQSSDLHLPIIIENSLTGGRSRHLLVIWDQWKNLPHAERSGIILEAFERTFGPQVRHVTVAMGLTAREALSLGYLKYKIEALVRKTDHVSPARIQKAMESVGGVVNRLGSDIELRFATSEQAQEAYRELQQLVPGPFWTIIQESAPEN